MVIKATICCSCVSVRTCSLLTAITHIYLTRDQNRVAIRSKGQLCFIQVVFGNIFLLRNQIQKTLAQG